ETGTPLPGQEYYEITEFRKLGEEALSDCEFILADPNSTWEEIEGVCQIARDFKTGRRFVPLLVQRLAAPDAMLPGDASRDSPRKRIRESVIYMLRTLGDTCDAWVLIRVLREQQDSDTQSSALAALTKLGGQPELEAVNAWLAGQDPGAPRVEYYRKCRDQLE